MTTLSSAQRRAQRLARLEQANAVIQAVAAHGRRFFYNEQKQRVGEFRLDARGVLWFIDEYNGTPVYVAYRGRWRGFNQGGTMRSLVEALMGYIREGTAIHPGHFGPWNPKIIPEGDLWGYGAEAMNAVRAQLENNPAVRPRAVPTATVKPAGEPAV